MVFREYLIIFRYYQVSFVKICIFHSMIENSMQHFILPAKYQYYGRLVVVPYYYYFYFYFVKFIPHSLSFSLTFIASLFSFLCLLTCLSCCNLTNFFSPLRYKHDYVFYLNLQTPSFFFFFFFFFSFSSFFSFSTSNYTANAGFFFFSFLIL